ncbi:Pex2_Pex12 domain-containing protein [Meloidogyne graminicola]|uniref:Peroxisome assembly protein 12 n=1 Tax=Meloidogyne graminicola TaxID=189291 RepID=A0A8S9ZY79_9BILA|nr:Pex2_Pex12 domain-containing protein [Meloidogyne graminicola]
MSNNYLNNGNNNISIISTNRQSNNCNNSLPSIFDYLAQDSLRKQLKPGILAAIKLFSNRFPIGSFSENFYGMKRVPLNSNNNILLSFGHKIRSLITLVILPNIVERITLIYENIKNNSFQNNNNFGWRYFLLFFFPHLKAFNYFIIILFQIGYSFSLIKIPSWIFLLSGTRLEIINSNDDFNKNKLNYLSRFWHYLFWLPSTIGKIFSFSLFLVQFLEICYKDELGILFSKIINEEKYFKIKLNEYPINKLPIDQQILCRTGKCPICKQLRINEAVLSISGYIFCYSCISKFILINGCCPVTSLPATKNEIIKIYRYYLEKYFI